MPTSMLMTRRRRTESTRSTGSVTPADELSSWLPDDVCSTCQTIVPAGQLYCSQQCRQEDAKAVALASQAIAAVATPLNQAGKATSDDMGPSSAPAQSIASRPPRVASSEILASRSPHHARTVEAHAHHDERFRYPCPPSPSILAKYGAHLTSPALAALDRRPSQLQTAKISEREFTSSSEESSSEARRAQQSSTNRRSSSRSTYSSASEAAFSTDPSTPSPASRPTGVDDLDDLEPTDLSLPPSVHPAATVMLNAREARSPAQKRVPLPANPPIVRRERVTMMSFARRPSRTNLPAPVLFTSPDLSTTVMKKSSSPSRARQHEEEETVNRAVHSPSMSRSGSWSTTSVPSNGRQLPSSMTMKRSSVSALPVSRRNEGHRRSPPSPPQVASASSSAGRTLRAMSPIDNDDAAMTQGSAAICGRFGCSGLSSSAETNLETIAAARGRRASAPQHKHTHSAKADLHTLAKDQTTGANAATTATKLRMTPMLRAKDLTPSSTAEAEEKEEQEEPRSIRQIFSPPRGRSKARGTSSTSRRSSSPPRGVARRGRSEDMLTSKQPTRTERPSVAPSPTEGDAEQSHNDADADDEQDNEDLRGRGRSPTERGRSFVQARRQRVVVATSRDAPAPMAHALIETLGQLRIDEANQNAKRTAPPPVDTPGSTSEVSVADSTGYDEVQLDDF